MSKATRLAEAYERHISIPWHTDSAAAQRVIFCVYDPSEERRMRFALPSFELATVKAGHTWRNFDLTDTFADWLAGMDYAESYYKRPQLLSTVIPKYRDYIVSAFSAYMAGVNTDRAVVALSGVGALFGLLKVKEIVDLLAPMVEGRLLVLFPGSYEGNNYRLLDGYDGWNYHAVPITLDK